MSSSGVSGLSTSYTLAQVTQPELIRLWLVTQQHWPMVHSSSAKAIWTPFLQLPWQTWCLSSRPYTMIGQQTLYIPLAVSLPAGPPSLHHQLLMLGPLLFICFHAVLPGSACFKEYLLQRGRKKKHHIWDQLGCHDMVWEPKLSAQINLQLPVWWTAGGLDCTWHCCPALTKVMPLWWQTCLVVSIALEMVSTVDFSTRLWLQRSSSRAVGQLLVLQGPPTSAVYSQVNCSCPRFGGWLG